MDLIPNLRRTSMLAVIGLLTSAAQASQVGAYTMTGLTGLADVTAPSFSGGATQDYLPLAWPLPVGAFSSSLYPLGSFNASSAMQLDASVVSSPGSDATPLTAHASASADLVSGHLSLAARSGLVPVLDADQHPLSAFSVAHVGAELGEGLELRLPYVGGTPTPVDVQLRLSLRGSINDVANGASIGLWSTLRLSHVEPSPGASYTVGQERLDLLSAGLVNQTLSLNARLIEPECSASLGLCSYWFSVYTSLDGSGEVPLAGKTLPVLGAGDALDFSSASQGAQLQLLVPAGASVRSILNGQAYAWVSAVPELPSSLLWAGGLLGLMCLRRRRIN